MIKAWIHAFRLRTLPLSASGILLGNMLAMYKGHFSLSILLLSLSTTFLLQILSNLANDYGDFKHGVDNDQRLGPERSLQSGAIQAPTMKRAIYLFSALSLISGLALLWIALAGKVSWVFVLFLIIGLAGIAAAIKYTVGTYNFGYRGLGDLVVFIFFGLAAVIGTYYLQTGSFNVYVLLPAVAMGTLSSGVLNINNLRDFENDQASGKHTLIVRMGYRKGKIYHNILILLALASMLLYFISAKITIYALPLLLPFALLLMHTRRVWHTQEPQKLDPELKKLSLSTFLLSLIASLSLLYLCLYS